MAKVTVDGITKGTVDLYAASINWQVVEAYAGLQAGNRTIVVTVLGTKNISSTSSVIMVDAFIVD